MLVAEQIWMGHNWELLQKMVLDMNTTQVEMRNLIDKLVVF